MYQSKRKFFAKHYRESAAHDLAVVTFPISSEPVYSVLFQPILISFLTAPIDSFPWGFSEAFLQGVQGGFAAFDEGLFSRLSGSSFRTQIAFVVVFSLPPFGGFTSAGMVCRN